ncbi:hypothetical protein SDC9_90315 [bioreactor metagenome]|uniref:HTH crp-type domain-containing protein n=1 Tax=bioreactor metagenome TaxID=1076179 RepID=A0A644ZTC2_9ZZZZ
MELEDVFPVWNKLTQTQQHLLNKVSSKHKLEKGMLLHKGSTNCVGLVLVETGQFRAYIVSETGKEVTLYRLLERDICLFSASCVLSGIQFEVNIEAEKDCEFWVIPPGAFQSLMEESAPVANYANKLMASRFSDGMWLMDQVMFKSFDVRLAEFLISEANTQETNMLEITHEKIANHLGSAREVVTRMLKYFQNEGMVKLARGKIEITDRKKLEKLI